MTVKAFILTIAVAIALPLTVATPANASGGDGDLESGEFGFMCHSTWYKYNVSSTGPNGFGAERDYRYAQTNIAGDIWTSYGHCGTNNVKNNASHVWNRWSRPARVFYHSYGYYGCWCGVYDPISAYTSQDLSASLANDNAAFRWY